MCKRSFSRCVQYSAIYLSGTKTNSSFLCFLKIQNSVNFIAVFTSFPVSFLLNFSDCFYENQHVEELKCFTIITVSASYEKFGQIIATYSAINQGYSYNKSGYNQFGNTVTSEIQSGDTSVLIFEIAN